MIFLLKNNNSNNNNNNKKNKLDVVKIKYREENTCKKD